MGLASVKPKPADGTALGIALDRRARAVKGDEQALSQLVELTQDSLFRFCYYLTADRSRAEDLAQETYLKAFEALPKLREPGRFSSWLLKVSQERVPRFESAPPAAANRFRSTIRTTPLSL